MIAARGNRLPFTLFLLSLGCFLLLAGCKGQPPDSRSDEPPSAAEAVADPSGPADSNDGREGGGVSEDLSGLTGRKMNLGKTLLRHQTPAAEKGRTPV